MIFSGQKVFKKPFLVDDYFGDLFIYPPEKTVIQWLQWGNDTPSFSWESQGSEQFFMEWHFGIPTMCGPRSIAKLVPITPITMVYGSYNFSYWGLLGGPHCIISPPEHNPGHGQASAVMMSHQALDQSLKTNQTDGRNKLSSFCQQAGTSQRGITLAGWSQGV